MVFNMKCATLGKPSCFFLLKILRPFIYMIPCVEDGFWMKSVVMSENMVLFFLPFFFAGFCIPDMVIWWFFQVKKLLRRGGHGDNDLKSAAPTETDSAKPTGRLRCSAPHSEVVDTPAAHDKEEEKGQPAVSGDLMLLSMLKSWRFLHSQCILC